MTDLRGEGPSRGRRGSALLAVVATVAVLSVAGFGAAAVARSALERASERTDSTRAHFLARGGIEAALLQMADRITRGTTPPTGTVVRKYQFSSGLVEVRIVSEAGKINVNRVRREPLSVLLRSMGVARDESTSLADRILEYRSSLAGGQVPQLPLAILRGRTRQSVSSFRRRAASIQMIEELLNVEGLSPGLVYGRFETIRSVSGAPQGLRRVGGLLRFLRCEGAAAVDANAAPREVLLATGVGATLADRLVAARQQGPLRAGDRLVGEAVARAQRIPLATGADSSSWTLTSTARLDDARGSRTVTAIATTGGPDRSLRIARWYEQAL